MPDHQDQDNTHLYETEREASALRAFLRKAREADEPDQRLSILIDVVDSLIEQLSKHARTLEDLRSDMTHKQGIVTKIGGGEYGG